MSRHAIITALGVTQILAWGSSYYLPAVLAAPIARDTGWSLTWIVGGLSFGLLVAAVVSPHVGRAIERRGGRQVLALSAIAIGAGQIGLATAPTLPLYIAAWLIIGLGMGAGLYDAAFGTLGRLYGHDPRATITTLTLFGGFASTMCWPFSAFLVSTVGWRGACLAYAAIQLCFSLPLYLLVIPLLRRRNLLSHLRHVCSTRPPAQSRRWPCWRHWPLR
jgi:MFS family permease